MKKIICSLILLCFSLVPVQAKDVLLVSIDPIAWILEEIAGKDYEIISIVHAGASPHTFEPTPRQLVNMSQAKVYFCLYLPFELQFLNALKNNNPAMVLVDLNENVEKLPSLHHGNHIHSVSAIGFDVHTWLDPLNARHQAQTMLSSLISLNPARAAFYEANFVNLNNKLADLHETLTQELKPCQGRNFLVYHPAYAYFAHRYGLEEIPVEFEGKQPSPKQLMSLHNLVAKGKMTILLLQPQYPHAGDWAVGIGVQAVAIDPLNKNYVENLKVIGSLLQKTCQ